VVVGNWSVSIFIKGGAMVALTIMGGIAMLVAVVSRIGAALGPPATTAVPQTAAPPMPPRSPPLSSASAYCCLSAPPPTTTDVTVSG